MSSLALFDPEIFELINKENKRQVEGLELIASENVVAREVMEAMGTILTNKYAEGYPGKRYYGGCEYYDQIENLARDRLCRLFGAEHANVQPHSGSQANEAVYLSCLKPGDKILSQSLTNGGHLSHGDPANMSGKFFDCSFYGVDLETEVLDYGAIGEIARKNKPDLIVCGASAYPREIDFKAFAEIAEDVGARSMADIAHISGLCCTGIHNSPVGVTTYTTSTTHKTLRGPRGGVIMCNKEYANSIDKAVFPGMQGGPLMHVIAAKAVCFREALTEDYKIYAKQVVKNSKALAGSLQDNNFRLVSGGTDNHLCLVDLSDHNISGVQAEKALGKAGITVNKNTIPRQALSPLETSGIRIGTPTITTRGMKEEQCKQIGDWIAKVLNHIDNDNVIAGVKAEVTNFCLKYPLYPEIR
ncbi:MAG: serine hydroxymethyltransferase [Methanocorpusculum sp.]|nr:serine hydroxymethyltransferase [Methanocorpusculum sp.]MDD2470701.1 serine hydroxymethyltransferase [Methanocorpusculum sp.]MDD4133429.1 serine hydroxymethyltransferase [Methanocorpusculum sp.]